MEHQAQKPKLSGLYQAQETKMLHQRKTRLQDIPDTIQHAISKHTFL